MSDQFFTVSLTEKELELLQRFLHEDDRRNQCQLEDNGTLSVRIDPNGFVGFNLNMVEAECEVAEVPVLNKLRNTILAAAVIAILAITWLGEVAGWITVSVFTVALLYAMGLLRMLIQDKMQAEFRIAERERWIGRVCVNNLIGAAANTHYARMINDLQGQAEQTQGAVRDLSVRYAHLCQSVGPETVQKHIAALQNASTSPSYRIH